MWLYRFLIIILLSKGLSSQTVTLVPESVDVMENSNITLTCTTFESACLWSNSANIGSWPVMVIRNDCLTGGFLNDSLLYSTKCHGNGSFSVTILKANVQQHNATWQCRDIRNTLSNKATVYIQVPVKKVGIFKPNTDNITLIENQQELFSCNTSYSRPTPYIKWFIWTAGKSSQINATSYLIKRDDKGFESSIYYLNISVTREQQQLNIYCTGENGIGETVVSRNVTINVHYAPEGGPYIDKASNNSVYTVKENSKVNLTCVIPLGNPLPKLSWNCSGTQTYTYEDKKKVRLNIQWQAKRDEDRVCTCTSEQEVAGKQTTSIKIVVFYPTAIEKIKFRHSELSKTIEVNKTIHVIENETFTLICDASGKPEPSYNWAGLTNSNASNVSIVNPASRKNYVETCHATNVMKYYSGEIEKANINRSVNVDILYPPELSSMNDIRVIEGTSINLTCPIRNGNPNVTSCQWKREFGDRQWFQPSFTIKNISRSESMRYTCEANNTMVMTGNIRKIGLARQSVSLEVLYPPSKPTLFLTSISETSMNITVTDILVVAENTQFTLLCTANSLPKPNYYSWNFVAESNSSILESPGLSRSDKKEVTCNVSNTMVSTDGTSKTGKNDRTVTIDIQFPPDIENMSNISSEEGTSVIFSCPVIHGNPEETTVKWVRTGDGKHWNKANFTLKNISRTDSSVYTCRVNNTMTMTGGLLRNENKSKSIELNVLYKAFILNYVAVNISNNDTMTIDESRKVNLSCTIEGNPSPFGDIFGQDQLNTEKYVSQRFTRVSATFTATCSHRGIYTCRGTNVINKKYISERNITLYVTCAPRQDPNFPLLKRIKTYKGEALIVHFTILAYPEPTDVKFVKYNGQNWIYIDDNSNFEIVFRGVDIHFIIHHVSEEDYGKYNFTVTNEFGMYEHVFFVEQTVNDTLVWGPPNTSTDLGLVIGLPLAMIIITVIIIVGIIWYRKRNTKEPGKLIYQNVPFTVKKKNTKREIELKQSDESHSEELQDIDDVPTFFTEPTEYYNTPEKIEQIGRIKISELYSYVSEKSYESFGIDYQKLPSGIQKPCTYARKPENLPLNRYNGIYPYDHSRVKIPSCPDFFINACYIDGYKKKKAYIASLGPTTKTTSDFRTFWQMVWHEETDVIVMLTKLNEPSGMKCEQYWPPNGSETDYGGITVISQSERHFAEYTFRTFQIIKDGQNRRLTHLHFTAWPDKTVPEDATCLLEFRRRMKSVPKSSNGPIIVHCSAGIGRTGTLIAIDRLIEEGKDLKSVNVYECVEKMRDQRVKMVQTLEQYVYIFKALVNALVFDCETIPFGRFVNFVEQVNSTFYQTQYKQLSQSGDKDKKEDSDARAKHMRLVNYNRQGADIPGSRFRVMLCLTRQCGNHDYINAVYMNSFEKKDSIITAQTPLPDTVEDFISMIYNENCNCVVTMEDLKEPGAMVGQYISASNRSRSFGNFTVFSSPLETKDHYIVRQMKIKYNKGIESKEKVVYHFQFTKWMPEQDTPVSATDFLHFIEKVEHYDKEFGDEYSHILVHCLKANERSGLFCAVKILTEKINEEKDVNFINVLRHLRTRRPSVITSPEQIKFCYQAVSTYIKMQKQ